MKFLESFMNKLWYSQLESDIFICICKYGPKPVWTIAKLCKVDRTYCYKVIQKLLNEKIINQTVVKNIKNFFVSDTNIFKEKLDNKKQEIKLIENDLTKAISEIEFLNFQKSPYIPKITIFDNLEWISNLYDNILQKIEDNWFLYIQFFASQIFGQINKWSDEYSKLHKKHIKTLQNKKIIVDWYLWNWILVMETLGKTKDYKQLSNILPWLFPVHWYIVGDELYMIQRKEIPLWFKFNNPNITELLSFLFGKFTSNIF